MSSRFFSSLPALVLGLTLSACLQANGETCQLNTDCESGNCCKEGSARIEIRGVCSSERCAMAPADAGPGDEVDAAMDAATDAAIDDAGPEEDAEAVDDGGPDASTPDASTPDSSTPDAATDAGADASDAV